MKGFVIVLLVILAYGVYAFLRGQWPFHNRAIADCAAVGDVARCLQFKYGWSERDALVAALKWRTATE
jgi:hypothetical protein